MPVRELSDYFHTHIGLPNTQPDRNITLLVATLLRRPYQITIGQKCFTVARNCTRHRNKNFSLNVFILSKTELHHAKQKICFCFTACQWLCMKTKTKCFVSLSFQWFGSETKTKCFCCIQFLMIWQWNKNILYFFGPVGIPYCPACLHGTIYYQTPTK